MARIFSQHKIRRTANLPDTWDFSAAGKTLKMHVPGCWETIPEFSNYRGKALYETEFFGKGFMRIVFNGVSHTAKISLDGEMMAEHYGAYSAFDFVTEKLEAGMHQLVADVDNSFHKDSALHIPGNDYYSYGGITRPVELEFIENGIYISAFRMTPVYTDKGWRGRSVVSIKNLEDKKRDITLSLEIAGKKTLMPVEIAAKEEQAVFFEESYENAETYTLSDPKLYFAELVLYENGEAIDKVFSRFGCRSYEIDAERGFILNGEEYPLRGVSRHQDRWGFGNALLPEHHEEDMDLICEVGATTIRLAHYQHDQYFYDLCDEYGMVIWAEIPYISKHMPTGRENTISQMKELIVQNYNHPSIVVWGLSNEISMNGSDDDLIENHKILNDLCHEMDKTRLTTIAVVSMCSLDDPYIQIPDVVSHNHYFGWYGGDTSMNGPWFDNFHAKFPNIPVGMSEYGCEALNWHTSNPQQGDYTEEYQAYYHEELIKQLFSRKYIWATHVWNMYDFGADARAEGGENGQNHKGLITIDRKYKKDAFYAYKAWLSDEPFVHLCSKRYIDRIEDMTKVTVYSNLPSVELFANGESQGGAQSAALAGIDPRVTAVSLRVPAFIDVAGWLDDRRGSWPATYGRRAQELAGKLPYYDGACLLTLTKAKIFFEAGLVDYTCPPGCVAAGYNNAGSEDKTIVFFPYRPHTTGKMDKNVLGRWRKEIMAPREKWLNDYLK